MQVESTNDSSILSKRSMIDAGYFDDEFLPIFCEQYKRRAPIINLGYYVRATVMHNVLLHFYLLMKNDIFQVLSLGAGFDTTFFRMFLLEENVRYYEIDFPAVVKNKTSYIMKSEKCFNALKEVTVDKDGCFLSSLQYCIFSHDLARTDELISKLESFGFNLDTPTIIFSECAITYMKTESCDDLLKLLAAKISRGIMLTYEQIQPNDGFGTVMLKHFESIHSPLQSVKVYKTLSEREAQYLSAGWDWSRGRCVYDLFRHFVPADQLLEKLRIEPFDEFEEWVLKCCHYTLTVAANSTLITCAEHFINSCPDTSYPKGKKEFSILDGGQFEGRFACGAVELAGGVVIVGGVSRGAKGGHQRSPCIVQMNAGLSEELATGAQWAVCYPSVCPMGPSSLLVMGGRTSPSKASLATFKLSLQPNGIIATPIPLLTHLSSRYRFNVTRVGEDLYLFGGRTPQLQVLDDLWKIELNFDYRQSEIVGSGSSPKGRFSHAAASDGFHLFISGGLSSCITAFRDVWCFDAGLSSWTCLQLSPPPLPRFSHTCHVWEHNLVLIGGVNECHCSQPGLCIIDLKLLTTQEYRLPNSTPERPIMLHNHASTMSAEDETIRCYGGGGNCFSFGTHFNGVVVEISLKSIDLSDS